MSLSIFLFLVIVVLPNKNKHKRNDKESDKKKAKDIIETDFDKRLTEKGEKETEKQSYESSQRYFLLLNGKMLLSIIDYHTAFDYSTQFDRYFYAHAAWNYPASSEMISFDFHHNLSIINADRKTTIVCTPSFYFFPTSL